MPARRLRAGTATVAVAVAAAACSAGGCSSTSRAPGTIARTRSTVPAASATVPTTPPSTLASTTSSSSSSTTTTVDPGSLPQTTQLPSPDDPSFRARLADLWQAITTGNPAAGLPAFFPLSAYIQVKAISDPVHDYDTRLIPDYEQDILTIHSQLGADAASATFSGVTVPGDAVWVTPGVEYNKGSYWRVYGTEVTYQVGGRSGSFEINSMISWRGEWYVVHLRSIR